MSTGPRQRSVSLIRRDENEFNMAALHDMSYSGLRRYIIVTLFCAAAVPLVLIGGGIYYEYRRTISEKIQAQLTTIVLQHKEGIEQFLLVTRTAVELVATLESRERLATEGILANIFAALQYEYDNAFEDLGVIDAAGNHLAYVGPYDLRDRNYSRAPWFLETMEKPVYISDVFLGFRRLPHFIIAVKKDDGDQAWILRATVNAAKFGFLVENVRLGRTGEAFIVNYEGRYQTRPRGGANVMDVMPEAGSTFLELAPFEGVKLREAANENRRILRAKTWLKNDSWMLIVQQDVDDAFAELFATRNRAIVVTFLGAVLVGVVAFATTGLLVRRIIKADQEKKILDEQLIQSQKLALIGEFSTGIAHEINNPLAVISEETGWMQDLLKRPGFQAISDLNEFTDSLREIGLQTRRCGEITHKLLRFARKMDFVTRDLDINLLIEEVIQMREREASYKSIFFHKNLAPDLPTVYSDAALLRQVLLNVVNNAIDAMPRGGRVFVETAYRRESDAVVVTIRDTGIGISPENLQKIFNPFFTTKPPGKGTGLGLSICHGIVEKLGGTISAASEPGWGTTFSIQIPAGQKKEESEHACT